MNQSYMLCHPASCIAELKPFPASFHENADTAQLRLSLGFRDQIGVSSLSHVRQCDCMQYAGHTAFAGGVLQGSPNSES